jgi:hypothetical protein
MAHLYYGGATEPIEIPDRLLAHLKVVIATKLRRGESFTLSWQHAPSDATGRSTIWLQPSIELRFVFSSPEQERLDQALLQKLAAEANSTAGITVDLRADASQPASLQSA